MKGHDELIGNIGRQVPNTFYKSWIVPKVELLKIDQMAEILTNVGKPMCDE